MRQSSTPRRHQAGFTLVELLVVIAIIGTLVALLLPAVQAAREAARNNTCKNNMRQLALALTNYDSNQSKLPGYINDIEQVRGGKDSQGQYNTARQASWIVTLFPYLEANTLWDRWNEFPNNFPAEVSGNTPELEFLICPSNPPEIPGSPRTAYVGNSGQMMTANGQAQNAANGVFLDRSTNRNALGSSSQEDGREGTAAPQMSMNYLSSNDGASNTVMLSESLYSFYWTYTDGATGGSPETPVFNSQNKGTQFIDNPRWFGFVWTNATSGNYINGLSRDAEPLQYMSEIANEHAFPSSNHSGGVNMAFGDARVVFVTDNLDPTVYGQLMTTNARRSNYAPFDPNGTPDRNLPPVSSDQF